MLRYLEDCSPAADDVAELLLAERSTISWINLGEVFYVIHRAAGEDAASPTVRDLRDVLTAELPDHQRVLQAAQIKSDFPLACADAFAVGTALDQAAELRTGDPELLVAHSPLSWRDLR